MRPATDEDAVRAAAVDGVTHDRPDVILVAHVLEDGRRHVVLTQDAEEHLGRRLLL